MALVTSNQLLDKAMKEKYAVPAFNANCLEMIPALIQAAEAEKSPLILQIGKKYLSYMEPDEIGAYAIYLAKKASVPICVHLDHGADMEMAERCVKAGFTSIMYDGSSLPEEENIYNTREIVKMAAVKGIPVEGEIGQVLMADAVEDLSNLNYLTEPEMVVRFVVQTGVSSVAVAVGNVHRMMRKEANIDFQRICDIREAVAVPLVVHGSSGISDEDVKKAIRCGISKINVATEFNREFVHKSYKYIQMHPDEVFPMQPLKAAMDAVMFIAQNRIRVVGAAHKYG